MSIFVRLSNFNTFSPCLKLSNDGSTTTAEVKVFPSESEWWFACIDLEEVWTFFSEFYEFKIDFVYTLSHIYPAIICRPIYNYQLPLLFGCTRNQELWETSIIVSSQHFNDHLYNMFLSWQTAGRIFRLSPLFSITNSSKLSLSSVVNIFVFFFITTIQVTPSIFLLFMISGFIKNMVGFTSTKRVTVVVNWNR